MTLALTDLSVLVINKETTDNIVATCNKYISQDIPRSKYNPYYLQGMNSSVSERDVKVIVN